MPGARAALPVGETLHGDCLPIMRDWPDASIDLIYLDPPFNTGRTLRNESAALEFADQWDDMDAYLAFIRPRIEQAHRLLRPTGSILVHCDWRTVHHLRLMLDDIFGAEHFVNHLIWRYGLGGSSPRRFARKHDDILFYGRSDTYHFEAPLVPATSQRMKGQLKKATDVLDVPAINNMASERVGYPTQKPLALLEVLVRAVAPVRGIVLDPFCGSGTTLVAAATNHRAWIGIDRSEDAVCITRRRLSEVGAEKEPARSAGS